MTTEQPAALRLAAELDAVPETGADPQLIQDSAAELRRLHAESDRWRKALPAIDSRVRNAEAYARQEHAVNERLRAALAGPEPEPVGHLWVSKSAPNNRHFVFRGGSLPSAGGNYTHVADLYAAPPQHAPKPQPVAWAPGDSFGMLCRGETSHSRIYRQRDGADDVPLYAAPPQREPLTDEQISGLLTQHHGWLELARAIERAHGIGGDT